MRKVNPMHVLNAKHALTYNAVYDAYGEDVMIAYENIVGDYIEGKPASETNLVIIAVHLTKMDEWNTATSDISLLLQIAKEHAQKEIDMAVERETAPYINMDIQSILD